MEPVIKKFLEESIAVKQRILADEKLLKQVDLAAKKMVESLKGGGTIYLCGNGGSACDAMHFTEELVARYKRDRQGYRAMHFLDPSTMTCWSNDYDYNTAFERQAEVFCTDKDIFIGITTSGNSANILKAAEKAKVKGAYTIALSGKNGGMVKDIADITIIVPSKETDRIQESHITLVHIFCEMIETSIEKLS